jgi:hypothetical protein
MFGRAPRVLLRSLLWSALAACSSSHSVDGRASSASSGEQPRGGGEEPSDEPSPGPEDEPAPPDDKEQVEDEPELAAIDAELTYYRDVKPILDEKCTQCHVDGGIGPYPFTTYDEVKPFASLISYDVVRGIMPPWRASGALGVFQGDRRLTNYQKRVIKSWVDQGTVEGDPEEEPRQRTPAPRGLGRIDDTLELPADFTPGPDPDTYRCFVFEWPHEQAKYITGLGVVPSAPEIVHHAVVYLVAPGNAEGVRAQDAQDEPPGYDCFSSISIGSWLTSYEPGGYGQELPGGLGMAIEPGSVIVVQMHYNTLNGVASDRSRLELTLEDEVERVGRTSLILNIAWPLGFMNIPAGATDYVHRWVGRPLDLRSSPAQDIFAVDLHMHTLATAGSIGIVHADGSSEPLLEIPDWAFEWQETYRLAEPVRLAPDDQLYVECHYDNSAEHQLVVDGERLTPREVNWGERTTDEMCLGNVLITPSLD